MIGWSAKYNWTYEQVRNVLDRRLENDKEDYVCLDVEHSDRKNMDDIIQWATKLGYKAEEVNCDLIKVRKVGRK